MNKATSTNCPKILFETRPKTAQGNLSDFLNNFIHISVNTGRLKESLSKRVFYCKLRAIHFWTHSEKISFQLNVTIKIQQTVDTFIYEKPFGVKLFVSFNE